MLRPCAASAEHVDRAAVLEQAREPRAELVAEEAQPLDRLVVADPEPQRPPRALVERRVRAPSPRPGSSTTQTGIDGEQTPVIGPTWSCSLPGSSAISPRSSSRSACRAVGRPSPRTAPRRRARGAAGRSIRAHSIGGPACSSVRSREARDHLARGRDRQRARARSPRSARPRPRSPPRPGRRDAPRAASAAPAPRRRRPRAGASRPPRPRRPGRAARRRTSDSPTLTALTRAGSAGAARSRRPARWFNAADGRPRRARRRGPLRAGPARASATSG